MKTLLQHDDFRRLYYRAPPTMPYAPAAPSRPTSGATSFVANAADQARHGWWRGTPDATGELLFELITAPAADASDGGGPVPAPSRNYQPAVARRPAGGAR